MEYLREFVAVVDEGSMCHAARKLFITQSVLSKHMQNLEKEFDSQLFMRTATGIRPTPLGHKAYSAFRSIIDEYDDFCVQAHDDRNHMSGQLSTSTAIWGRASTTSRRRTRTSASLTRPRSRRRSWPTCWKTAST